MTPIRIAFVLTYIFCLVVVYLNLFVWSPL